jgi:hypothetical protein
MRVWVEPSALGEIAALPGHVRQRVRRAVSDLRETPRPSQSRPLEIPDDVQLEGLEARRLGLDNWRIVYAGWIKIRIGQHRKHSARFGSQRLDRRANLLLLGFILLILRDKSVRTLNNGFLQRLRQRLIDHRDQRLLALLRQNWQLLLRLWTQRCGMVASCCATSEAVWSSTAGCADVPHD